MAAPLFFLQVVHANSVVVGASGAAIDLDCRDDHDQCDTWAADGECTANAGFMLVSCRKSCYACQSADCHNDDEQCERWAEAGECARNEGYMISGCAHACHICFVNQTAACRRETDATPAARAGTIDANFERLVNGPRESPRPLARVLHREPWIVAFDNFLSAAEADELVRVSGQNFEQSRFLGDDKLDGRENPRTSTTSWCNFPSCLNDPTFQRIRGRISDLVGVPWAHSEHLQLLRYERGQYYRDHHDQIAPPDSAWGPRLYTFFMYLSDVEEGGGTRFTKLNLTVAPVKGMAILWPSVLSSNVSGWHTAPHTHTHTHTQCTHAPCVLHCTCHVSSLHTLSAAHAQCCTRSGRQ